jgi:hypothetical protein
MEQLSRQIGNKQANQKEGPLAVEGDPYSHAVHILKVFDRELCNTPEAHAQASKPPYYLEALSLSYGVFNGQGHIEFSRGEQLEVHRSTWVTHAYD